MYDFIKQLPGVIYELSIAPDGARKFTYISSNSFDILGVHAEDVLNEPSVLVNLIVPEDRAEYEQSARENYYRQGLWNWEGRMMVRGNIRWVEARSNYEKRGEEVIRKGIIIDITERKHKEQEIELRYQFLLSDQKKRDTVNKRNETLFTQLFNSIPMGVVMLDALGKVVQVNEGFREMFGYDLEVLKGKNLNDYIVPDELRNEGIDLNNLITANKIISVSTIRKHIDGRLINVILYGVPVLFDHQTIGIYGVYVDITDRKKVEEELKIRNAELDNFVYKVSHDLRAPLSSILGLVNLARLPGNDDNPMDYINIIGEKVEDLDHFISDVLSHSKNLKMEVSIAKVDFNGIISRTFADLSYLEGASEMLVYRKVNDIDFYSDPWRISEIIRNLVSNAIKYRQVQGPPPEIRIEINSNAHQSEIVFSDNGIGIESDKLSKIFDMFYRATEQSNGSGIGLYIVKNAIEKLGGTISVTSEWGVGTTFTIVLPNSLASIKDTSGIALLQRS